MGIYNNTQIRAAIQNGTFVCVPFQEAQLSAHALQLHLGSYYYAAEAATPALVHSPLKLGSNKHYFDGPFRALTYEQQTNIAGLQAAGDIPLKQLVILLAPGQRIVAHAYEFVGIPATYSVGLQELPGWLQNGVRVTAAFTGIGQVIRPGFVITNTNSQRSIVLPVGATIADLTVDGSPGNEPSPAHFGTGDVDSAISTWTPSALLTQPPKLPAQPLPHIEGLQYE